MSIDLIEPVASMLVWGFVAVITSVGVICIAVTVTAMWRRLV